MASKIYSLIEKNRWTVIVSVIGLLLWIYAGISCVPVTQSPIRPSVKVTAIELQQDYEIWQANNALTIKKFDWAVSDIEQQKEQWAKTESALMSIASSCVTSWSGLISILMSSGIVGLFADNIRKNGVIGGLKRNKDSV